MTCGIGAAFIELLLLIEVLLLIGLLLVLTIGFGLVLAEGRRSKSYEGCRGHVPPRPIPAARDVPPPPPPPKKKD